MASSGTPPTVPMTGARTYTDLEIDQLIQERIQAVTISAAAVSAAQNNAPSDGAPTSDKIDYFRLARVIDGLKKVIEDLTAKQ